MKEKTVKELMEELQAKEEQLRKANELNKELSEKYNSLKEDYYKEIEEGNVSTA